MDALFNIGIILLFGYLGGFLAEKIKLPKIVGYIIVGVLLEPQILGFLPANFIDNAILANDFALALITFSIGGSLFWPKIKQLGKSIVWITILEAELAFIFVAIGMAWFIPGVNFLHALPLALLLAALASPTDPTATLAVAHEYKSDGPVTRTLMGVAASDDALGIINFSIATAFASALLLGTQYLNINNLVISPLGTIFGSILAGIIFGLLLSLIEKKVEEDGALIALVMGMLFVGYGFASYFKLDELLTTMTIGIVFVNFSQKSQKVFSLLSNYFEEIIFIIFFVLAGAHLQFNTIISHWTVILIFVLLRLIGKTVGTVTGARISHANENVRKYLAYGLVPQGGIVIGLALLIKQMPQFAAFGSLLINLILGTVVVLEFIGPIFTKYAFKKAGEIN